MSTNTNNTARKLNMDPRALTFINEDSGNKETVNTADYKSQEDKELREFNRLNKLKNEAVHLYMPDDPAYVMISDDLLAINELSKTLDASTRVMINVALGDYGIFRKKTEDEDNPEKVKLNFRRVYFEDFERYQDVQDDLNDLNRRITLLESRGGGGSEDSLDKLRQYKKDAKEKIKAKIETGLEVFFKKSDDIIANSKEFDYNDLLFNIEIGVFRYTRAPFLRQISSTSSS